MNLISLFRKGFDFFVFTSLFIACCAIAMAYQTCLLFDLPFSLNLAGFVGGGTICSYNFHWFLTPPGVHNPSKKLRWNISNKKLHLLLSFTGFFLAAYFSLSLLDYWKWLLFTALITFLYSAPKIAHPWFMILRKIAIAKTIYLSLVWTLITVMLPIVIVKEPGQQETLFFINRFFFIYAICILFDYRDVESDRKAGIKSLITFLDERGVHLLFWSSILVALVTQGLLWPYFDLPELISLTIPLIILICLYQQAKKNFSDYLYYFILDGLMALSAPLIILAKFAR